MENDRKKRKNTKKKSKQAKSTEDITRVGGTTHLQQNLLAASEPNIHLQSSNGGELDNSGRSESDARPDQHELDKQLQKHTFAMLEGQLACLESEKSYWMEKKAILEGELTRLEFERRYWLEKEASLGGCIRILEDEKKAWTLEEGPVISAQPPGEAGLLKPSPQIEVPTVTSFDASVSKTPTFKDSAPIHDDTATVQTAPFPVAIPTSMYPPQSSEKVDSPLPMDSHLLNHVDLGSEKHAIPSEDTTSQVKLDEITVTYDNIEIVEEAEPERKASEDGKRSTELVVEGRERSHYLTHH